MITNFTEKRNSPFEIVGNKLRIHFNEQQVVREDETTYNYTTAVVSKDASRSEIIEAIIGAEYSIGSEIATINNKEEKPEEYQEYQDFRTFAKSLADQWLGDN